jgi:hypothetical protein
MAPYALPGMQQRQCSIRRLPALAIRGHGSPPCLHGVFGLPTAALLLPTRPLWHVGHARLCLVSRGSGPTGLWRPLTGRQCKRSPYVLATPILRSCSHPPERERFYHTQRCCGSPPARGVSLGSGRGPTRHRHRHDPHPRWPMSHGQRPWAVAVKIFHAADAATDSRGTRYPKCSIRRGRRSTLNGHRRSSKELAPRDPAWGVPAPAEVHRRRAGAAPRGDPGTGHAPPDGVW